MSSEQIPAVTPPPGKPIPRLESGDRLSREEFERRYDAMPHVKKAELIEGVVYLPSPVRYEHHGRPHFRLIFWLGLYECETPGVEGADNGTALDENDRCELLEGYLVEKARQTPLHAAVRHILGDSLDQLAPNGWKCRFVGAITLADSEPEPDLMVIRDHSHRYMTRHPGPDDVGLVVEVADSTLQLDREFKARIYARAGLPVYWIINIVDRQVEVYTQPSGPTATPAYGHRRDFAPGTSVPLVLDGTTVGQVAAADLLP